MKRVLVDSSVWISYFKDENAHANLTELIKNNQICINNLILAELVPYLHVKNQIDIINLLIELPTIALSTNWEFIINLQIQNIRNGINGIGIPELLIIENVVSNGLVLYSEDKHFPLINEHFQFDLFGKN
jgi:predicted nucleic acid-binding protein